MNTLSIKKHRHFSAYLSPLATIMIFFLAMQSFAPRVSAGPISSLNMMAESTREADLATIQLALENKMVQQRLEDLGFTPEEIHERLAEATDAEIHQLAAESEVMMAGGGAGLVVTVLVVILLVLVILRITSDETNTPTDTMAA